MAWIESHQEISRHPKTKDLADTLGISIPQTVGHLHILWHWCLDYAQDGNLSKHTPKRIASAMMYEKDPDELVHALIDCGFIEVKSGVMHIHDWFDYGGRLLLLREANKERQRKFREKHGKAGTQKSHLKMA